MPEESERTWQSGHVITSVLALHDHSYSSLGNDYHTRLLLLCTSSPSLVTLKAPWRAPAPFLALQLHDTIGPHRFSSRGHSSPTQLPIIRPSSIFSRFLQPSDFESLALPIINPSPHTLPVQLHAARRGTPNAHDRHVRERIPILKVALHRRAERSTLDLEFNLLSLARLEGLAVVEVEVPMSATFGVEGDEDGPGEFAGVAGGEGHWLRWEDGAAADVDGDVAEGCVDGDVPREGARDGRLAVPVVVALVFAVSGEDAVDARGALVEHGCDEDVGAEEELAVCVCESRVVGVFPRHVAHDGVAFGVGEVEKCVHVREELEADVHCRLCCVYHRRPDVGFLGDCCDNVVIPVKGEESRQAHPSITELFIAVTWTLNVSIDLSKEDKGSNTVETTCIDAKHRYTEEGEGEGLRD
jgi:hypothetical protein